MSTIQRLFYQCDPETKMPLLRKRSVRKWLPLVFESHQREMGIITYRFTNDREILEINQKFLDHDYYTDIITFDVSRPNSTATDADIVISLERVAANAEELGVPYEEELHRVMIHGILHLVGMEDTTNEQAQAMREAENQALDLLREIIGNRSLLIS